MARKTKKVVSAASAEAFQTAGKTVIQISVEEEASRSYLEYSYAVIYDRALPDARDGLKPVHRRILYGMQQMGLRPEHAYMKCARVVGEVMGKFHPHGDSAIYEAMVRMAQDFSLNTPMVDGHGNFGSPNDGPAASRYTEARMDAVAMLMIGELTEGTVNMIPNYDGSLQEPSVLPAAFPNLLVNGSEGIAVGMATKMIPHNLGEAIAAARMLLAKPKSSLDDLMTVIPGPDLPTGGVLLGMDGVREAYETGKGTVRIRATVGIAPLEASRGRVAITVTELPYGVGTEKVVEKIKAEINNKRIQGISDIIDLTDGNGIRLVIECKTGVNADLLLNDLYRLTPMEVSFGISNLALVNGVVKTLGLKELLEVFVAHRLEVVTRRTQFRLDKAEARKHIVDGMLIALDNVDAVVKIIRGSKDSQVAREALMKKFALTDIQTGVILDMPLRRLVALEVDSLRRELADLLTVIAGLMKILGSDAVLKKLVDSELADVSTGFPSPRRTVLMDGALADVVVAAPSSGSGSVEVEDVPVEFVFTAAGFLVPVADVVSGKGKKVDAIVGRVAGTTRSPMFAVTSKGRAHKFDVSGLLSRVAVKDLVSLVGSETVLAVIPSSGVGVALGTANGVVKVVKPDFPSRGDVFDVINLDSGDSVVNATFVDSVEGKLVSFVTSAGNLTVFELDKVRPQGRSGAGMVGVKIPDGVKVVGFAVTTVDATLVTTTGSTVKMSPLSEYPVKGRGTGGVKAHKFGKGEEALTAAWITASPVGKDKTNSTVDLPAMALKRDGAGVAMTPPVSVAGSAG